MRLNALRLALALLGLLALGESACAEPYLALQSGLRCAQCHVNQTGGGMRTPFGNAFAQAQLAAHPLPDAGWDGRIGSALGIGADIRVSAQGTETAGEQSSDGPDLREARLYLQVQPIAERLALYLDQYLGPGPSANREAFALLRLADGNAYLKAGRFYLPFGWRLQDASALVNAATGLDMAGPDRGVELGFDHGAWSLQFAISNGTFGQPEVDSGKEYSLQLGWIQNEWRVGVAANLNQRAIGDSGALAVFGGLRTGPLVWLAECAIAEDRAPPTGPQRSLAWLAEGNWRVAQGHNLKLSAEGIDPDRNRGNDRQQRLSLLYEYTPIGFVQLRLGMRQEHGPSAFPLQNRRLWFAEMHGFF